MRPALTAAVLALAAAVVVTPVTAAAEPGWRVLHEQGGGGDVSPRSVAALGPNSLWVSGLTGTGLGPRLDRWDGRDWHPVELEGAVHRVVADDRSGLWALGSVRTSRQYRGLLSRWDGRRWTTHQVGGRFATVQPEGPSRAVLFGTRYDAAQEPDWYRATIAEFDGTRITATTDAPLPPDGNTTGLRAADSRAGQTWAVGAWTSRESGARPYAVRRDAGGAWRNVPLPAALYGSLDTVAVAGPDQVWVAGSLRTFGEHQREKPIALRWDGQTWHEEPLPLAADRSNVLVHRLVVDPADPAGRVAAVGAIPFRDKPVVTGYLARRTADGWHQEEVPAALHNPGGALHDAAFVPGTGQLAVVGHYLRGNELVRYVALTG